MGSTSALLALLYAGPGSAVCRQADGRLEVVPTHRSARGRVVLTQEQLLDEGLEALLALLG